KVESRVWPSGVARATISPPMRVDAPGLLSTKTACPHFLLSRSAKMRVMRSGLLPGGPGSTIRTLLLGQAWAREDRGAQASRVAATRPQRVLFMLVSLFCSRVWGKRWVQAAAVTGAQRLSGASTWLPNSWVDCADS